MSGAGNCFVRWLSTYKIAWENHDLELIASLFTANALYYITPFGEPLVGREAIVAYWRGIANHQREVKFAFEIVCVGQNDNAVAHWNGNLIG